MDREEIERRRDLTQEEINEEIRKECKGKLGQELRSCAIKTMKKLKTPFFRKEE